MKEPVLQDKRSEHVRFCRYAAELTERVSGKPLLMGTDVSLARLQRANVVAQSRITFSEKELLMLIRNHLVAKGLHDTANTLVKEGNLPAHCQSSSPCVALSSSSSLVPRTCRMALGNAARVAGHVGASPVSSNSLVVSSPSSRPHVNPHPPSAVPHAPANLPPVGRILFSRERPPSVSSTSRKLCPLKEKSDSGAFIQVSRIIEGTAGLMLHSHGIRASRDNDVDVSQL